MNTLSNKTFTKEIVLLKNERWWGGTSQEGLLMPFGRKAHSFDLRVDNLNNQAAPLLLSSQGRVLWSEEPFKYTFTKKILKLQGNAPFSLHQAEGGLGTAYKAACERFFPPSGKTPPRPFFAAPQMNTWIELNYSPTQKAVLDYARKSVKFGIPPGVIMIDDGWQRSNGDWEFRSESFPDPAAMVAELKQLGFKVMLWMIHCISPDTATYRELLAANALIVDRTGEPLLKKWWNGISAQLDLTSEYAQTWLESNFKRLRRKYRIDGFKLDGADFYFFDKNAKTAKPSTPQEQSQLWAKLGLDYPYNEFRGCWKMGAQPLVQRLWDRTHSWEENGLTALVPNSIGQSLLGHAFICPDMIGGGMLDSFHEHADNLDQELIVRMAQCSALMPMMQFSAAPWRILDKRHFAYCLAAIELHQKLSSKLWKLAKHAGKTGEPILRPLAYVFENCGLDDIMDQFMLGDDLLAAPVLEKGATHRMVHLPPGEWKDSHGQTFQGETCIQYPVTIESIPHFHRAK